MSMFKQNHRLLQSVGQQYFNEKFWTTLESLLIWSFSEVWRTLKLNVFLLVFLNRTQHSGEGNYVPEALQNMLYYTPLINSCNITIIFTCFTFPSKFLCIKKWLTSSSSSSSSSCCCCCCCCCLLTTCGSQISGDGLPTPSVLLYAAPGEAAALDVLVDALSLIQVAQRHGAKVLLITEASQPVESLGLTVRGLKVFNHFIEAFLLFEAFKLFFVLNKRIFAVCCLPFLFWLPSLAAPGCLEKPKVSPCNSPRSCEDPSHAGLWGLAKSARLELDVPIHLRDLQDHFFEIRQLDLFFF